ncbi:MAG: glutaredoxin family protein [Steroidobacteraceae bacterium]
MKRALLAAALCVQVTSAGAQLYRWTDSAGRVHYTDTPPPAQATEVQRKRASVPASGSPAEPFVLQRARKEFPVTLYTTPRCDPCDEARSLLNVRGVPFREVSVTSDPKDMEALNKAVGSNAVPSLVVGRLSQAGFEARAYHSMLDSAGYPESGILAPRNQHQPEPEEKPMETKPPELGPYAPAPRR